MAEHSAIAWTDHTFNPWWGCTKVSTGCEHCYAETLANRFEPGLWGPSGRRRFFGAKHWAEPLRRERRAAKTGKRERVFVGSMCDVFEERNGVVGRQLGLERDGLMVLINDTPHLDWLLLTKRPYSALRYLDFGLPDNLWLGVTAENQAAADDRIPDVALVMASTRFVSCEPLLGPVSLDRLVGWGIQWVIAGCESGPRARPADIDWFRSLRDQCIEAGVPFFLKQMMVDGKLVREPELDGRQWLETP